MYRPLVLGAVIINVVSLSASTSAYCLASTAAERATLELPTWQEPAPADVVTRRFKSCTEDAVARYGAGMARFQFFPNLLPAVMRRTLALDAYDFQNGHIDWIFTGPRCGLTLSIQNAQVGLIQRFYDSVEHVGAGKHPELRRALATIRYIGHLQAVTVELDSKLGLTVALNGVPVHHMTFVEDLQRHQLHMLGAAPLAGRMLRPATRPAHVVIHPTKRHQTIMGFGGITSLPAYRMLSDVGRRRWWQRLCEYNLLIQREYPCGWNLDRDLKNMDDLDAAVPHYYGDNFPNSAIVNFNYLRRLREIPHSKVWYEYWKLPIWAQNDADAYARSIVHYCRRSLHETGSLPDVVGVQNEHLEKNWHAMVT